MKKRLGPSDRIYPMPSPLVVGGTMEEADTLAVAWIGIAGGAPPSIGMALRNTRRTLELIRETGEFTVNVPTASQAAQVDFCGITSGRDHDKFAEAGLTRSAATVVATPLIEECPYNLECRVTHEVEVGEYIFVIGEVVESHAEENVLDDTGAKVDVERLDPLIYIPGSRDYHRLGAKVADAFSVGKTLRGGSSE